MNTSSAPHDLDSALAALEIPADMLPADGRFGSGPSRVRIDQLEQLMTSTALGTSHRQGPVRNLVQRLREGLAELLRLPGGYEIVLGNGGSTAFWDIAALCLIDQRSQHVVIGEFSSSFAAEVTAAPHLQEPILVTAPPGHGAAAASTEDVDAYAWPHNETSTGVLLPVRRPAGARANQLVLVDGTSAAGGVDIDITQTDAYYFAPQKCLGSDGGLWIAALSPTAIDRAHRLEERTDRWVPRFLSLVAAIENSRKEQTVNTPAIATLELACAQVDWLNANGGLGFAAARTARSSSILADWAQRRPEVAPFVSDPAFRSPVVTTLDIDERIDARAITSVLRDRGIRDIEPYRKLGRNQLRIATFPSVPADDVMALTEVLDLMLDTASAVV